ncbi:hypothetical protein P3H15_53475 [Rhodococcus sp. T2V]|nr:hypothetical protein [Rhodococcus sp. T2V]MDF3313693.1 hypothetical protein [Rhodococcus sp. T2V]
MVVFTGRHSVFTEQGMFFSGTVQVRGDRLPPNRRPGRNEGQLDCVGLR